ncbi:CRISPR-associated helicase/endonuclease Cas3 [Clostridium saccharobutylicum]|uniref:Crispr-associated helicase Cas3 n=1 Tax=Clostridium saccharobutylicum DSM 13864 TaxID=1345695 RepID=U5MRS3_CLOSA|nr:CRISPR-associated helicase/endonuclease Cas3 [Clostridium saccharobutylicum]AGX43469.1 crispr-associated helicase Cas3 [Clostridium saccharobutylicum DSM 13864]AQR90768.1 CRISPR-associated nuclease/helicase Cas3 [Clostridium saccharobutylicum]AQS00672.1 CRISPR-associated nuclease/helicase Cas3 [Clostridium saccharobutylicum]AQS14655.1 CRISPR-associated nuclease/helicase Cas3 [Clostridium saccharobutylicum]MBA2906429.1 CRISPR-associated endonuclease/helicase Cas3 [Clostridium saccharobutylic
MYFNENYFINIDNLLSKKYSFYAHLKNDRKETLKEHTELCKNYFNKLVDSKGLDRIFLNFEEIYLKNTSEKGKLLFRELLMNTIVLHDIGKINPFFQSRKMGNNSIEYSEKFCIIDSQHSIISAVLYLDYFMDKVLKLEKDDKKCIRLFMFLNAYIISKHHGNLEEFKKFLSSFDDDEVGFKVMSIFNNTYKDIYLKDFSLSEVKMKKACNNTNNYLKKIDKEKAVYLYTYERLLYSLLVACDFYATTEFMNGVELNEFGEIAEISEFYDIYKSTSVYRNIRKYENEDYYKDRKDLKNEKNINILRNEMFLDAEKELSKKINEDIFYLEAPTGSGKSNVSINLSFKLFEDNPTLKKIFYVYPFNTLVEQNLNTLNETFGENEDVFNRIAVINSISPIKMDENSKKGVDNEDNYEYYAKALLNRQFLNYPIILTTHVSLFNSMFNSLKESAFAFHQLVNSVIVLDEIQSYKNIIWAEIILFLKGFAKILNMKVIIMSATLPNLNILTSSKESTATLIEDRNKYFSNSLFKDRVKVSYELMDEDDTINALLNHVIDNSYKKKKILIEFIKKESAYNFYRKVKESIDMNDRINCSVELMTGDDNSIERQRILKSIKSSNAEKEGIILVATQVIEAGVDIDMDIGYKDISKLDSDEQFLGRINRSCKRRGVVYFFNLDRTDGIYKNDVRVNTELSLLDDDMKRILVEKNFEDYYLPVLNLIQERFNNTFNDSNLEKFLIEDVGQLNTRKVEERMKLIEEDNWNMSIYLARIINKEEENTTVNIDGKEVWESYKDLLANNSMQYAEKQVKLSEVKSKMNYFIYQINKNSDLLYNDKIGELYYIKNGEKYFDGEKLNKDKFKREVGIFV